MKHDKIFKKFSRGEFFQPLELQIKLYNLNFNTFRVSESIPL